MLSSLLLFLSGPLIDAVAFPPFFFIYIDFETLGKDAILFFGGLHAFFLQAISLKRCYVGHHCSDSNYHLFEYFYFLLSFVSLIIA